MMENKEDLISQARDYVPEAPQLSMHSKSNTVHISETAESDGKH